MSLIRWERFRGVDEFGTSAVSGRWPQLPWHGSKKNWTPASTLTETDNEFIVRARMPGVSEGDVMVQLEDGALVIQGEVHQCNPDATFKGTYLCRFNLPGSIDAKRVLMTREDNVVTVHVPKLAVEGGNLLAVLG
jgi:HSP20 family protein